MEPKCFIIPSRWYKITICRLFWVNLKLILPPPDQQHYHWGVVTILRSKPSPWTRALADPTPSIHKHSWIQRSTLPPPTISFAVPHSEVHTEPDHLVVCHVVCPQATSWGGGQNDNIHHVWWSVSPPVIVWLSNSLGILVGLTQQ